MGAGVVVRAVVCVSFLFASAGAEARPRPEEVGGIGGATDQPISDDVIVDVLIQTQRIVVQTATVGAERPAGPVRDEARRVAGGVGRMLQRLEGYARKHPPTSMSTERRIGVPTATSELGDLLDGLRGLEPPAFNHAFLAVLHDFLGQMVTIVRGAEQLVSEPSLRAMLTEMERELGGHHEEVEVLQLRFPPPTGLPESPAVPQPAPAQRAPRDLQ